DSRPFPIDLGIRPSLFLRKDRDGEPLGESFGVEPTDSQDRRSTSVSLLLNECLDVPDSCGPNVVEMKIDGGGVNLRGRRIDDELASVESKPQVPVGEIHRVSLPRSHVLEGPDEGGTIGVGRGLTWLLSTAITSPSGTSTATC